MPQGFLGTRADLLVDVVFVVNVIAPIWAGFAAWLARKREHRRHMKLQLILWATLFVCVLLLEGNIRLSGGSGSLVSGSPYEGTTLLRTVFLLHIGPAVLTYVLWLYLVVASFRRWHVALPGGFSGRHKKLGKLVILGLVWVAASAAAVYWLGFAAT